MTKRKIIIFGILCLANISLAQENNPVIKTSWSLGGGAGVSPRLSVNQTDFTQPRGVSATFNPNLSGWVGGFFQFRKNKKLFFSLGAITHYQSYGQTIGGLYFSADFDPTTGLFHPSNTIANGRIISVDIPFKAYLKVGKRGAIGFGIAPSVRLSSSITYYQRYLDGWKPDTEKQEAQVQSRNSNLMLTTSYQFALSKKKTNKLFIEPYLNVNLLSDNLYLAYADSYFYHPGIAFSYRLH